MAIREATGVVAEAHVYLGLNVEVDNTKDALGGQEGRQGIDHRVVVGLALVSIARAPKRAAYVQSWRGCMTLSPGLPRRTRDASARSNLVQETVGNVP